nr:hypothetical protein [Tanacetum cinerariifolium]
MMEKSKLDEDKEGKTVDPSHYHGMIGTLLYLTSNRPDLQFAICTYADHVGCQDTRCSTSGSMQFLGDRLVSWSSKRQKSAAISSTKAEYIALSGCCAQILWMRSQLIDYGLRFNKIPITMDITRDQQVALDDALVPPANRLRIGKTDVSKIYMQELWTTATFHPHLICFKMNNKKHIMNLEYFREMLQICPRIPNQQFEEPPFEEAILTFLRELGHSGEIKMIIDVNVEHKDAKKSNEMYYPRFTKVIVNFFIHSKEKQELTNEDIRNFESCKKYYAIASGAKPPKTKASVKKKQVGSDTTMPHLTAKGKRIKTSAKAVEPAKKKQLAKTSKAKGLTVLSKVALTKAEQMKLATKRSPIQTHISYASGSGADEGTEDDDDEVKLNEDDDDVDNRSNDDEDDDSQEDDNQDDNEEQTNSDNDGDDFVHPKFSTHDDEDKKEESFDPRVQTPSHVETTDDEDNDEDSQGMNVEGDELDEEETNKEDEDVSVTTTAEPPLLSAITLPPPSTPIITHLQQTLVPSPANVTRSSLQDLSNFGSLFGFDHRLKALEENFSEFMQTN